jgi:dCTP deaminase
MNKMTVLSAQSIRKLCIDQQGNAWASGPLITPFVERGVANGRSFGLSACSYDCRISDGLIVPVRQSCLAATLERFSLPANICGSVLDKSTHARVFLSAFNTHLDPGWTGFLTVELSNLGTEPVEFEPGDPLVQIKFEWLDEPTDLPYRGKYQNQESRPVSARLEDVNSNNKQLLLRRNRNHFRDNNQSSANSQMDNRKILSMVFGLLSKEKLEIRRDQRCQLAAESSTPKVRIFIQHRPGQRKP